MVGEILNILCDKGYESYIVGGFVRDKLLGIENNDIDIITSAKPEEISNIFNTHLESNYGSVKLKYNNYIYEITTFRKESNYIDNRRPDNYTYITDVKEDLKRRDFTVNAILIDKDGNYIDYVDGINDLNNKILRCIGNDGEKIREDSLRILRAIRFNCIYDFEFDNKLEKAIIDNKHLLSNLSFDRIKKELNIVFNASKSIKLFNMINYFDLYKTLEIKPNNMLIETNNYLSIWAQLDFSDNYNFSRYEINYINSIKDILNIGINSYTVYKYNVDLVKESNKILKLDIDIDQLYNSLIIKNRKDIDITYEEILNIVNDKSIINKIYIDLEKHLLYNKLQNKKENIISYIEGEYIE